MRDQHPIDELFRNALINAERTPPAAIWSEVSASRSWGHRYLGGWKRRWKYGLLLLLLLTSAGGLLLNVNMNDGPVRNQVSMSSIANGGNEVDLIDNIQQQIQTYRQAMHNDVEPNAKRAGGGAVPNGAVVDLVGDTNPLKSRTNEEKRYPVERIASINSKTHSPSGTASQHSGASITSSSENGTKSNVVRYRPVPSEAHENKPKDIGPIGTPLQETEGTVGDPQATFLSIRQTDPINTIPRPQLRTKNQPAPKALPPGEWFVAGEIGIHALSGKWVADRSQNTELATALDRAEIWTNSTSVDFVLGRKWYRGMSLSLGVGLENMRSNFKYDHLTVSENIHIDPLTLDTTTTYTEQTFPSASKNVLSVLRIPVEFAWHKQWRRYMVGPRVGLINEVFLTEDGLTLAPINGDSSPGSLNNDHPTVAKRYPFRLSGALSLDLGYMMTESLSFWITPTYTADLVNTGTGDLAPDISRLGARVRLQFLIPTDR